MPFGIKDTAAPPPAPPRIDFDALWKLALAPALEKLGYRAVRADQDVGPLIIKEMLERLYYSDLVLAEVSIANANAYYEVGIRHAARTNGCVLVAADWARPVFDLAQVRHIPYPNPAPTVDEDLAAPIIDLLFAEIPKWAKSNTPMGETIAGYPKADIDNVRARQLAGELEAFEALRAEMKALAGLPKARRKAAAAEVLAKHPALATIPPYVAVEMVKFIRDVLEDWQGAQSYIESLPEVVRNLPIMTEQLALALSKQGNHLAAIAALHQLIAIAGDSSERQGLLGGRYKRLYDETVKAAKDDPTGATKVERSYLGFAIKHYEQGMELDLNEYYPSSNLPALYRERGQKGDEDRTLATANLALLACQRSLKRNTQDEWGKPTLLVLAFAARNLSAAQEIADQVINDAGVGWKLKSVIEDLRRLVDQTPIGETREGLLAILLRLEAVL